MTPTPDQTPESSPGFKAAKALREAGYLSSHYSNTHQLFTEAGKIIEASFVESSEELTALRARLAEAEKVRDAAYREAEILRTNATYVKKVLDCANRYMPDLVKGAITVEGAIQERDTLRATNATLFQRIAKLEEDRADLSKCVQWLIDNTSEEARRLFPGTIARLQKIASAVLTPTPGATNATLVERVRSLEEALTALSNSAKAAAEWCNTSMMDTEIMHAESILTDSASPDPVLPIKLAFCSLHQAWLVAHHRSCMNETMDALAVVLGLDPMNPSKGLPTTGAAVGKEGE